ncbi:sigma-70 family RNA polymerase sigma factor [Phyllobacterium sp. YR531]|uniref:sigma-70 family RNA polymerase sigma factor n=1 Tax=Phyllobacterium sp. YR531 TaxID=1144343 RepID=UPI00026F495F|nr:sigma-70 family RNA polymerase sigma factor [Phyllobacterium sp. YR531]EJN04949.1 RNA polymerase sigma factor, sigma-70 family [Phyllobacterium sp. YR531]
MAGSGLNLRVIMRDNETTGIAQPDLAAALIRCTNGDKQALRAIFEAEGGRLIAIAQRIVRRRELAEEVVQDSFVQIWTKSHQYDTSRGSARGWIYAIVRNKALNTIRASRHEDLTEPDILVTLADANTDDEVDQAWADLGAQSRLRQCLAALEETKRKPILMAYICGYTHGEIAGRLRIPLGTAKAWIRRGLSALRECMA